MIAGGGRRRFSVPVSLRVALWAVPSKSPIDPFG